MRTLRQRGFTLIELLVVIAIIGLLSTLAVVALSSARLKARDAKRVSDIKQVQTALDLHATDKNGYPADGTAGAGGVTLGGATAKCLGGGGFAASSCTETIYMPQVPANPTPGGAATGYSYASKTGTGTDCDASPCIGYALSFVLEADTGELKDTTGDANTVPDCTASPGGITCS